MNGKVLAIAQAGQLHKQVCTVMERLGKGEVPAGFPILIRAPHAVPHHGFQTRQEKGVAVPLLVGLHSFLGKVVVNNGSQLA